MNWEKGYSASYYMTIVDPQTWRDIERVEMIGGSIKRGLETLRESATIDCQPFDISIERWVRIYMDTEQAGDSAHTALFTGLATQPENNSNGAIKRGALDCYSVLKPADEVYLMRGWYAPAGANGGAILQSLLAVTPAPVVIAENAPALSQNIIAEKKETNMTMVEKILTAMNWQMRIDGDGTINAGPVSADPVAVFSPTDNDCLEKEVSVKADWYDCPNVFMAADGDITAIARDDDRNSPLSTISRGREVWAADYNAKLADNESIGQYAQRMLMALQKVAQKGKYTRRFFPGILPGDVVGLNYPDQGLNGNYTVQSQSINLAFAARTSEEVMAGIQ